QQQAEGGERLGGRAVPPPAHGQPRADHHPQAHGGGQHVQHAAGDQDGGGGDGHGAQPVEVSAGGVPGQRHHRGLQAEGHGQGEHAGAEALGVAAAAVDDDAAAEEVGEHHEQQHGEGEADQEHGGLPPPVGEPSPGQGERVGHRPTGARRQVGRGGGGGRGGAAGGV